MKKLFLKIKANISKLTFGFAIFIFLIFIVQLCANIHMLIEDFDFDDIFNMIPSLAYTFGAGTFFLALYKIIELLENKH